MQEVYTLLRAAQVRFLAVCEGNQPHLYPFDAFRFHQGRLYFQAGRGDPVSRLLRLNPRLALCTAQEDGWLSVEGSRRALVSAQLQRRALYGRRAAEGLEDIKQGTICGSSPVFFIHPAYR